MPSIVYLYCCTWFSVRTTILRFKREHTARFHDRFSFGGEHPPISIADRTKSEIEVYLLESLLPTVMHDRYLVLGLCDRVPCFENYMFPLILFILIICIIQLCIIGIIVATMYFYYVILYFLLLVVLYLYKKSL